MGEDRGEPAVVIERRGGGGSGIGLFLLGAAVGAGIALLFAPQSGEETRAQLRRGARKIKRRARDLAEDGREAVEDLAQRGKSAAREARAALEERLARHRESFDGEDDDA